MKNKIYEKPWPVQPRSKEEKKRVSASSAETKRKYKRGTHRHAFTRLPVMEWESSERDKPLACSARVCDRRSTVRPTVPPFDPELQRGAVYREMAGTLKRVFGCCC